MRLAHAWIEIGHGVRFEPIDSAPDAYSKIATVEDVTVYLLGDGWSSRAVLFDLRCDVYEFIHKIGKWDEGV